jgi:calcineurin-like phosphoesterase
VVGTHTHVTTADDQILPRGTAYISDVGMTGPHDGVIGMDRADIVQKFLDGLPRRFEVAAGNIQMNCVLVEVDDAALAAAADGTRVAAKYISRLRLKLD